jgi:hypothetical protein
MASRPPLRRRRRLPLEPLLVLLCLSPACAAGRVPVSVYYEALCPFCSAFVVNDLSRVFRDGISSIAELRLVPFGNGRVSADGTVTCQVSSVPDIVSFSLFLELGMCVPQEVQLQV